MCFDCFQELYDGDAMFWYDSAILIADAALKDKELNCDDNYAKVVCFFNAIQIYSVIMSSLGGRETDHSDGLPFVLEFLEFWENICVFECPGIFICRKQYLNI